MTHPRLIPSNGRVAHISLKGRIAAAEYVEGRLMQVIRPVADLLRSPGGGLDCQLLYGQRFLVLEAQHGYAFGQNPRDGYVGYVAQDALGPTVSATHRVSALATHCYGTADMKSRPLLSLPMGAQLCVTGRHNRFAALPDGRFVPSQHLSRLDQTAADFVTVAESFLGIPYLWGGNSVWGMDCSGMVMLALNAAGRECPRDTDMQQAGLGMPVAPGATLERGDLVFWKGHVGVMQDSTNVLHANAHHMMVTSEPLARVESRTMRAGDGPIIARRRLQ